MVTRNSIGQIDESHDEGNFGQGRIEFVDEHEMAEIHADEELNHSLERGRKDAEEGRGRFL